MSIPQWWSHLILILQVLSCCVQVAVRHDIRTTNSMELDRPYRRYLFLLSASDRSFQLLLRASASSSIISRHGHLAILVHEWGRLQCGKQSIEFSRESVGEPLWERSDGCEGRSTAGKLQWQVSHLAVIFPLGYYKTLNLFSRFDLLPVRYLAPLTFTFLAELSNTLISMRFRIFATARPFIFAMWPQNLWTKGHVKNTGFFTVFFTGVITDL